MSYRTKQQQAILRCLEQRQSESLTAADLSEDLRQMDCAVGLATIYRQLEKLETAGLVHKVNTEDGAFYQFCSHESNDRRECFLLKCERCGRIRHLDCSQLQPLYEHLEQSHHFRINPRGTLLTGVCDLCAAKEEATHGKS